jgi:hypothetical protein
MGRTVSVLHFKCWRIETILPTFKAAPLFAVGIIKCCLLWAGFFVTGPYSWYGM